MTYPSIRIEGQIFSGELLAKLEQSDTPGQRPADFALAPDTKVKNEIAAAWASSQSYYRAFRTKTESRIPHPESRIPHPDSAFSLQPSSLSSETRNLWLIPLLSLLGYTPVFARKGEEVNGKLFSISHRDENRDALPLHLLGWNDSLDKRRDDGSGPRMSPHALLQEYLNLTEHLYGIVANGRTLRLLRDSTRLVRQSFIEFDLERMFDEDLFADFAVLYRLLHATRLPAQQTDAATSLIETYHQDALDQGARIRDGLSEAVKSAMTGFVNGFISHPANNHLRTEIAEGRLDADTLYGQSLRLIYRLLFLLVIEERHLVFPQKADPRKRDLYYRYYSLQRIRRLAEKPPVGDRRPKDLWFSLCSTFRLFEAGGPGEKLGVAPLAGDLFSPSALGLLTLSSLDNGTLLAGLRAMCLYRHPATQQLIRVNYASLNVEEFGSVYEKLLKFIPVLKTTDGTTSFTLQPGPDDTQSHYTPDELVQPLIQHSLDHLITAKLREIASSQIASRENSQSLPPYLATSLLAEKALLSLRVADISCGSGHILLAAARRIATELAVIRTGEEQPSPTAFRAAVRDVITHCIYGVDLNPLAVDLCKVALWLEAHNPGQPLNFLDHHIKCGNAIVGYARREEVERGVPDEAFKTLPDDDKTIAAALRKRNKAERNDHAKRQRHLDFSPAAEEHLTAVLKSWREVAAMPEKTPEQVDAKKQRYEAFASTTDAFMLKQILAIPLAQFYIPKTEAKKCITDAAFREYWFGRRHPQGEATALAWATAARKHFFHWFLEFPEIFANSPSPEAPSTKHEELTTKNEEPGTKNQTAGFDLILGNPPYKGGQHLSGLYGHPFCEYVKWEYAPAGLSDLVAYFVRRIYTLLRPGGFTAFITTNSIKDGDIRKDGLEQVVAQGGSINMAVRGIKWPGAANLVVSLVALHKGDWKGPRALDGQSVETINAFFEDAEVSGEPLPLPENKDKVFQGSIFLGDGFLLTHSQADRLRTADPRNADVVFPIINGQELNNNPDQLPGRSIINFHDWPIEKAETYPEPFSIVEEKVKPERLNQKDKGGRDFWWRFLRPRMEMREKIKDLPSCFAAAATTKHLNFSAVSSNIVFSHALYIFTTDRWELYAVVQSTIHEIWARKYSGSLETRLRYSPSDCFDTFPFPAGLLDDNPSAPQRPSASPASPHTPALADIGERYHEYRRALMQRLWLGLTDIYNLFHDPEVTPDWQPDAKHTSRNLKSLEKHLATRDGVTMQESIAGILELRRLHIQLDNTVLAAYGWSPDASPLSASAPLRENTPPITLDHAFTDIETLPENDRTRYTLSAPTRKALLTRLLAENHHRATHQPTNPKHKTPKPSKAPSTVKEDRPGYGQKELGL